MTLAAINNLRLTPNPGAVLETVEKATTTTVIAQGTIFKITSNLAIACSTSTDALTSTSDDYIGISEQASPSGSVRPVRFYRSEGIEYEVGLITATTLAWGDYVMLSTGGQRVAKAATTTDKRLGQVTRAEASATKARFRLFPRTLIP